MFESQFSVAAYEVAVQRAAIPKPTPLDNVPRGFFSDQCVSCFTKHTSKPKYRGSLCMWHPLVTKYLPILSFYNWVGRGMP